MVKKWDDNNLFDTLKKHLQFQKCGILNLWKFKVCTFEHLEFQNFKAVLPHINGVKRTWCIKKGCNLYDIKFNFKKLTFFDMI